MTILVESVYLNLTAFRPINKRDSAELIPGDVENPLKWH